MKIKKGFTLIELLAVIVILAIILLISVPIISGIIEKSKESALKSTTSILLDSAKFTYSNALLNNTQPEGIYSYDGTNFVNGVNVINSNAKNIASGVIMINKDGSAAIAVYDGKMCSVKSFNSQVITIEYDLSSEDCIDKIGIHPVLTLYGSENTTLSQGENYIELGYTAVDPQDGDLTNSVSTSGSVDKNTIGTYVITYSVTDTDGNTITKNRNIQVMADVTIIASNFQPSPAVGTPASAYDGSTATFYAANYGFSMPQMFAFELSREINLVSLELSSLSASGADSIGNFSVYGLSSLDYNEPGELLANLTHTNTTVNFKEYIINAKEKYKFYKIVVHNFADTNGGDNTMIREIKFNDGGVNYEGEKRILGLNPQIPSVYNPIFPYDGLGITFYAAQAGNALPHRFVFELESSIKLKKMALFSFYTIGGDAIGSFEVYGQNSLDYNEVGELLYTGNHTNINNFLYYNINATQSYKYYKIVVYNYSFDNGGTDTILNDIKFFSF